MEKPKYNFTINDPNYEEKRKQYLIDLNKYKYHTNKKFRDTVKKTSNERYQLLKEALNLIIGK